MAGNVESRPPQVRPKGICGAQTNHVWVVVGNDDCVRDSEELAFTDGNGSDEGLPIRMMLLLHYAQLLH